eukprot:gb/GECH01012112.1/.p1 GENE.gb/GECH01012112.1/~~gb/GECH01012112.1/.p1  ORF type:complete len:566 (+),score=161.64 gb/GECH01012112.1/:1-1698(+)
MINVSNTQFHCTCLNVTAHTVLYQDATPPSSPQPLSQLPALLPAAQQYQPTLQDVGWDNIYVGELALAGIQKSVSCLTVEDRISDNARLISCMNCNTVCCLIVDSTRVILNGNLFQDENAQNLRKDHQFSSTFDIVLVPKKHMGTKTVHVSSQFAVKSKEMEDEKQYLNRRGEDLIDAEKRQMEQRIAQFKREEQDRFSMFKRRVNQECTILFSRMQTLISSSEQDGDAGHDAPSSTSASKASKTMTTNTRNNLSMLRPPTPGKQRAHIVQAPLSPMGEPQNWDTSGLDDMETLATHLHRPHEHHHHHHHQTQHQREYHQTHDSNSDHDHTRGSDDDTISESSQDDLNRDLSPPKSDSETFKSPQPIRKGKRRHNKANRKKGNNLRKLFFRKPKVQRASKTQSKHSFSDDSSDDGHPSITANPVSVSSDQKYRGVNVETQDTQVPLSQSIQQAMSTDAFAMKSNQASQNISMNSNSSSEDFQPKTYTPAPVFLWEGEGNENDEDPEYLEVDPELSSDEEEIIEENNETTQATSSPEETNNTNTDDLSIYSSSVPISIPMRPRMLV